MTRPIVALCVTSLLAVSVLGFSLPDGGLLSNRDLDKLVGGTDSEWCNRGCTNCTNTMACSDAQTCTEAGVACPNYESGYYGASPEICDDTGGTRACDPETRLIFCATTYPCECKESTPGNYYCSKGAGGDCVSMSHSTNKPDCYFMEMYVHCDTVTDCP